MFGCERQQILKERVVVLQSLWANVTSCPNELTGYMIKVTSILKHWYCLLTECWTSPQWRIVCFKSTSCFFVSIFHRWALESQNRMCRYKVVLSSHLTSGQQKEILPRNSPNILNDLLNSVKIRKCHFVDKMWKVWFTKRIFSLFWM